MINIGVGNIHRTITDDQAKRLVELMQADTQYDHTNVVNLFLWMLAESAYAEQVKNEKVNQ